MVSVRYATEFVIASGSLTRTMREREAKLQRGRPDPHGSLSTLGVGYR